MNETTPTKDDAEQRPRLFTFLSGGWVILITAVFSMALIAWAVAPALMRSIARPPGDGRTVESYLFDLSPCLVDRDYLVPIMQHRDMVPAMDEPATMLGADVAELNASERGKFLVSGDLVIGVVIDGVARAYPIRLMNVHEVINDTLAGTPIAVTYNWPCDSVRVFERTVDGRAVNFAASGLLYNSNLLMYVRTGVDPTGERHVPESLWCQIQARAVTGPDAAEGRTLRVIPADLTGWATWLARHPDTTVVTENPQYHKRYEQAEPKEYVISGKLIAKVSPMPPDASIDEKEKVIAVMGSGGPGGSRVYPLSLLASNRDEDAAWNDTLGEVSIRFEAIDEATRTALVSFDPPDADLQVLHGYWFAIHAMYPDLPLLSEADGDPDP